MRSHRSLAGLAIASVVLSSMLVGPATMVAAEPDLTPPVVTPPRVGLVTQELYAGLAFMRVAWSGTDVGSGIDRYEQSESRDGGPWTGLYWLYPDHDQRGFFTERTYQIRIRAQDHADNLSDFAVGPTFRVSRYSDHNLRITYSGTWATATSSAYWNGATKWSTQAGARATITFTGKSIAWVATKGPNRGKAEIWVDGVKNATVDLYRDPLREQQVPWAKIWTENGTHTIQVRVLGTVGRPMVDVDGFVTVE
jgi:hypothetical protein